MDVQVSGQFDDADDNEVDISALSISTKIKNKNFDENEEYYDEIDIDKYIDYDDDINFEKSKAIFNVCNFENQVDLSYKNNNKSRATDKSDHATFDRVLDHRSMKIMFKMMRQGDFIELNGCISGGKEANVYHAPSASGEDLVLKVYMTAIMPFKARSKYMKGDNRFKDAKVGSSTKLVRSWAEKEFRNLNRLYDTNGAIPCPRPIKQKDMVVLMTMIGSDGIGAPRLKDVNVETEEEWVSMYLQVVAYVRIMYQDCHLVHADLSEYNLLYHEKKVYVIDVSQSVEHEHPETFNFLKKDCKTINAFFRNKNIPTLSLEEFFFFVIDTNFCKTNDPEFYPSIARKISESTFYTSNIEDDAFFESHIERYLSNIQGEQMHDHFEKIRKHPEFVEKLPFLKVAGIDDKLKNWRSDHIKSIQKYKRTLKLKKALDGKDIEVECKEEEIEHKNDEKETIEEQEEEEEEKSHRKTIIRPKNEDPESKKLRKKQVKDEQKETRIKQKQELLETKFRTVSGFKLKNVKVK